MIYVDKEGALRKTHSIHKLNTFNFGKMVLIKSCTSIWRTDQHVKNNKDLIYI